jgi:hypothetical protein
MTDDATPCGETGEVTPSSWQPAKPSLTPGPDLVGKVWEVLKLELAFGD